MTDKLVADLTEAIRRVQGAIGIEKTRRLLLYLAGGLGAPARKPPT